MSSSSSDVPPLVHAIGGSVGSALALLLLYPLERARIELQSLAAQEQRRFQERGEENEHNGSSENSSHDNDMNDHHDREIPLSASPLHGTSSDDESWAGLDTPQYGDSKLDDTTDGPASPPRLDAGTTAATTPLSIRHCLQRLLAQRGELYKGAAPIVTTLAISNFIFFGARSFIQPHVVQVLVFNSHHHKKKNTTQSSSSPSPTAIQSLVASTIAGIINVLLTNPLWVTNLRIVTGQSTKHNLFAELAHILRGNRSSQDQPQSSTHEIFQQLWQGTGSSLLLVSNPVIQFVVYEQLRKLILQSSSSSSSTGNKTLSPGSAFWAGALSKAIATIVTYPLQLTQAILRMQQRNSSPIVVLPRPIVASEGEDDEQRDSSHDDAAATSPEYQGTLDCLQKLYNRQGYKGLYTGLEAKMLQTVLSAAFTFLTYEQILRAVHTVFVRHRPGLKSIRRDIRH